MIGFDKTLRASGELIAAEGLASPHEAKRVRAGKDGAPITDGIFPETKEFLVELLDRRSGNARAGVRHRGARVGCARPGSQRPMNMAIEVRQVMAGPPEELLR